MKPKSKASDRKVKAKTLTKAEIMEDIRLKFDMTRTDSATIIDRLIEIIKNSLENGEDVLISGFGKFCVKEKRERKGRNPATGEDLILPARRVVMFKCSKGLREKINSRGRKRKTNRLKIVKQ